MPKETPAEQPVPTSPASPPSAHAAPEKKAASGRQTCVVYFHGMGEQRRHEEISRLVDVLDTYAHGREFADESWEGGRLRKIEPRFETPLGSLKDDVCYLRVDHVAKKNVADRSAEVKVHRFYEAYWAPVTAGGASAKSVLLWLLRQLVTPFRTLTSPWRDRQRLRRAALLKLWSRYQQSGKAHLRAPLKKVFKEYDGFEESGARRSFPRGSFRQFKDYLTSRAQGEEAVLLKVADAWWWFYVRQELTSLAVLLCIGLSAVLLIGGMLVAILFMWQLLAGSQAAALLNEHASEELHAWLKPSWGKAVSLFTALMSLMGAGRFLGDYVGDVQAWTTYSETDSQHAKREEILKRSVQMIEHVLMGEECGRVIIVAHSLGTAIALDALLQLARHNKARKAVNPFGGPLPISKIDTFITMGSPIDRIHYFFESRPGQYHRFNRVYDAVRGDISSPPLSNNRKPHIHWINFWDQGDPISSPLTSPSNGRLPDLEIDNVQVSSLLFPSPVASHSAYFTNAKVISCIYEAIFSTKLSFTSAPKLASHAIDYGAVFVGPGKRSRVALFLQSLILALPCLMTVTVSAYLIGLGTECLRWIGPVLGFSLLILIFGWLASALVGQLNPVRPGTPGGESSEDL